MCDAFLTNKLYAQIGIYLIINFNFIRWNIKSVTTVKCLIFRELNSLELHLLFLMNWNLYLSVDVLVSTFESLKSSVDCIEL